MSEAARPNIPDHALVRRIGRGAYGEVWLARNVMGTWRAVKIVRRESFPSERPYEREFEGIRRFEPVSRAHDTQVDILHVGRDDVAGIFYYVMELGDDVRSGQQIVPATYEPRTLQSELSDKKRLSAAECLNVGLALATALDHLHKQGLVHRDIKPSNIIFIHGLPKLADIGLVAEIADAVSFVGTEGYVPVEGPGTAKADIFGLGRVLYEISTGFSQRRFPEIPTSFGQDPADAEIARELNVIINRACARNADERHGSAAALRDELILLHSGHSIRRLRKNEQRLRRLSWFGLVAAVVAAFAIVGYISSRMANLRADANLSASRLAQAKSLHASDRAERRTEGLAAVAEAARIKPSRALRDEALALLPATDLGEAVSFAKPPLGFTPNLRRALRARPSPDGQFCAWMMDGGEVLITTSSDGVEVARLQSVGQNGRALEWSSGGHYLAAYYQQRVIVWDWKERRITIENEFERNDASTAAAFSENEKRVVLCLGDRVAAYDCASGVELAAIQSRLRQTAIAIHPLGELFGTIGPGNVNLASVATKAEVYGKDFPSGFGANFSFRQITWSRGGNMLAGVLTGGALVLLELDSGKSTVREAHVGTPGNIAFSPDGSLLLTASADDGTRLWDTRGGMLRIASIPDAFGLQFSADSKSVIFSNGSEFSTRRIDSQPAHCLPIYSSSHRMELTAFSPDGRTLVAMGDKHSGADLWDARMGKKTGSFGGYFGGERELGWVGFTRDGRALLAVGSSGLLSSSAEIRAEGVSLGWSSTKKFPLPCEPGDAGDTSPDGKRIAVRVNGQSFFVGDWAEPENAHKVTIKEGRIIGLSWSAGGTYIAVSNSQSSPTIYDAKTLQLVRTLGTRAAKITFCLNGKFAALATSSACDILNGTTFELIKSFERHALESTPGEIAFSDNGAFLAMTQQGRKVDLIDLAKMENVATFEPPATSRANRLLLSPDGTTLVLHDANTAYLYNLPELRRSLAKLGLDW